MCHSRISSGSLFNRLAMTTAVTVSIRPAQSHPPRLFPPHSTAASELLTRHLCLYGVSSDDLVTAVEFDETGDYLAVGDKAGRICVFDCHHLPSPSPSALQPSQHSPNRRSPPLSPSPHSTYQPTLEYKFYTEFQSHEPEFDCLKSLEIEEKINAIQWSKGRSGSGLFLLATNDKTIKYWKVYDKKIKRVSHGGGGGGGGSSSHSHHQWGGKGRGEFITPTQQSHSQLHIPRLTHSQTVTTAAPKRVYANAHGYHINSISINSDQQTFISADDLRINLWDIDRANESFNIVDIKPSNIEELTEVITAATFSPSHCHLLAYATSRGSLRLIDLREQALCDSHSRQFEQEDDVSTKSFFTEIVASIADVKFAGSEGRYVVSRDYLSVKVWDVAMESRPVHTINVHDYLKVHLADLYENDCLFDQFDCSISSSGTRGITGSYNNHFVLWSIDELAAGGASSGVTSDAAVQQITIEALKDGPKRKDAAATPAAAVNGGSGTSGSGSGKKSKVGGLSGKTGARENGASPSATHGSGADAFDVQRLDFGKKALHVGYHPRLNAVAVAGLNKLYIYQAVNAAVER